MPEVTSTWSPPSIRCELQILRATRTVAVVGMSADPSRPSYFVATYLRSSSCDFDHVWFVNPKGGTILDEPVYPTLADLPAPPDLVDVFRRPADLPAVAAEVVAIDGISTFWSQLGLRSDEAAAIVHATGRNVVMDRCLKIEHARFAGGLHLAGFDTRTVSSRRPSAGRLGS